MKKCCLTAVLAAGVALPVAAQEAPELSYGAAVTSNYIFRGQTQSDNRPALQGYVEGAYGMFYGGVWSSTVDIEDDNLEFDLYAGIRPTFGDLSVDLSYVRYLYNSSGDCCGEVILDLAYPMADIGELGAEFAYDPVEHTKWAQLGVSVGFLTAYSVGGTLGTDFGTLDLGKDDEVAWDLGVSRTLGEIGLVDLRYYDSNYEGARGVLSIAVYF